MGWLFFHLLLKTLKGYVFLDFFCMWLKNYIQCCDVQASSFPASGRLKPAFFWDFGRREGSGSAKFTLDVWLGGYLCTYKNLNF